MAGKPKCRYSQEAFQNTVAACKSGDMMVREAAKIFGVPRSTLHDHVSGKHTSIGSGGPTTLALKDEQEIVVTCQILAEMGFGLTRQIVERVVRDYVQENGITTPFPDDIPGKDWWHRFKKRWPCLTERKPQHLSKRRAEAANESTITTFFDNMEKAFTENGLDPSNPTNAQRIWNCDETAFCMSSTSGKLLCKRGVNALHEVGGGSGREYTTVHVCCSANGERLPPFILYKGKNLYQRWMQGGPAGAVYGVSELGWMDACNFLSWFLKLVCPAVSHLTSTGPVFLFMDGHHSHISLQLIRAARENNVQLFCLPPNCTHVLQPLDVGVFAPLKRTWAHILKKWKLESKAQNVSKEVFPSLLCQLWEQSFTPKQCQSGFQASGIFPLSREAVLTKLRPSQPFEPRQGSQGDIRTVTCDNCGHSVSASPLIRTNLRTYFTGVLAIEKQPSRARSNTRIRIEGEVITTDEFLQYLEGDKRGRNHRSKPSSASMDRGADENPSESEGTFSWFMFCGD